MSIPTPSQHPDLIELELIRTNEASASVRFHLRTCERCQKEVAMLDELRVSVEQMATPTIRIPAVIDAVILVETRNAVHRVAHNRRRQRQRWAIAASFALLIGGGSMFGTRYRSDLHRVATGDFNRDGELDVLDAYALATDPKQSGAWDLNNDGLTDEKDAAEIARRAVSLDHAG